VPWRERYAPAAALERYAPAAALAPTRAARASRPAPESIELVASASAPGVTVRAEPGMEGLAEEVARAAPAALAAIYADLESLPRPSTVEIRLVRRAEDLARAAPPGARVPAWADGVAFPRAGIVAVATRRGGAPIDVRSVVTHELAHMALGAALGGAAPRWLDEGFAYLHSSDFSLARAQTLTGLAWSGDRYFLFELADRFPPGENQAQLAYAQSYDVTAFLARRGRYPDAGDDGDRRPFRQFLAAIAAGHGAEAAAVTAYGSPLGDLEQEWWTGLKERYLWAPVGLVTAFFWFAGGLLLIAGWWRRRRLNRATLARWAEAEAAEAARRGRGRPEWTASDGSTPPPTHRDRTHSPSDPT
jgi:hypothetical protein